MIKLLQGLTTTGRRARIEIKDLGPQQPHGLPVMRCRMMLEGDDEPFELLSASTMIGLEQRFRDALMHIGENGVVLPSLEVVHGTRGFDAVMKPKAMRKLGLV